MPKILAFSGSLRAASWNKKLVKVAADGAREAGAEVTILDLQAYPLPVYDGDIEAAGMPENVLKLKQIFREHQGMLISSPEYNSSYSGAIKNTIDWISRKVPGEQPLEHFKDKPVAIMCATPGGKGGMRMLPMLRLLLSNIGMLVLPGQYGLGSVSEAFDPDGNLKDEKIAAIVKGMGKSVTEMAARIAQG
jgi:NAD(P)H-dependent FMN reductase